ncbi:MAG: aminotransferase class V-fold PLP-dependent enzyme, partial [Candidatus Zixiibacteriota bacterium]
MAHVFTPEARDRIARMPGEFSIEEGVTYLNAAAVGPLPDRTRQALTEFYAENASAPWKVDGMIESARETCRTLGAQLMNADPGDVTYGYSTSFGLSIAAGGLPLDSGDEVILSDSDFPANPYVWRALEQRGIKIKFARSVQGMFSIENAERLITGRTKVIAVSFVQFFNGYKLPLVELAQLAHSFDGYLVVDAIQGLGVEPLDFSGLEIDVLSAGAQKWLLGPLGIGIVAISSRARERMRPVARSW